MQFTSCVSSSEMCMNISERQENWSEECSRILTQKLIELELQRQQASTDDKSSIEISFGFYINNLIQRKTKMSEVFNFMQNQYQNQNQNQNTIYGFVTPKTLISIIWDVCVLNKEFISKKLVLAQQNLILSKVDVGENIRFDPPIDQSVLFQILQQIFPSEWYSIILNAGLILELKEMNKILTAQQIHQYISQKSQVNVLKQEIQPLSDWSLRLMAKVHKLVEFKKIAVGWIVNDMNSKQPQLEKISTTSNNSTEFSSHQICTLLSPKAIEKCFSRDALEYFDMAELANRLSVRNNLAFIRIQNNNNKSALIGIDDETYKELIFHTFEGGLFRYLMFSNRKDHTIEPQPI